MFWFIVDCKGTENCIYYNETERLSIMSVDNRDIERLEDYSVDSKEDFNEAILGLESMSLQPTGDTDYTSEVRGQARFHSPKPINGFNIETLGSALSVVHVRKKYKRWSKLSPKHNRIGLF